MAVQRATGWSAGARMDAGWSPPSRIVVTVHVSPFDGPARVNHTGSS